MEKWFGFYPVRKELEARISGLENEKAELLIEKEKLFVRISELENSNDQLWQAREKLKTEKERLAKDKTELIEKIKL